MTYPSSRCKKKSGAAAGFTLIETVVVVALTAFIMVTLTSIIWYFYRTNAYTIQQTQAVNSARVSIEHAMADFRQASYGADGSYPLLAAATSTATFFADTDGSGSVEKERYYLSGTTLYRGTTVAAGSPPSYLGQPETTTLVVDNIRNGTSTPLFTYFDSNGNQLSDPVDTAAVASVVITVQTDVDPNRAPTIYTLTGSATLRNVHNMNM